MNEADPPPQAESVESFSATPSYVLDTPPGGNHADGDFTHFTLEFVLLLLLLSR